MGYRFTGIEEEDQPFYSRDGHPAVDVPRGYDIRYDTRLFADGAKKIIELGVVLARIRGSHKTAHHIGTTLPVGMSREHGPALPASQDMCRKKLVDLNQFGSHQSAPNGYTLKRSAELNLRVVDV